MATDATGTPTSLGIPTFNVDADAPSGLGSNAQMAAIDALIAARAAIASPTFTGTPQAPTPTPGDNTNKIATTAFVVTFGSGLAPLASPTFTGVPAAPTPATGDNSTTLATTAFVKAQGYITSAPVTSFNSRTGAVVPTTGDYTAAQVTNAADKSSGSVQAFTSALGAPGLYGTAVVASAALGATLAPNLQVANHYAVQITNGGGTVTISNPTNPPNGAQSGTLTIQVWNTGASGEALSWGTAYLFSAWSKPASVPSGGGIIQMLFSWDPIASLWRAVGSY